VQYERGILIYSFSIRINDAMRDRAIIGEWGCPWMERQSSGRYFQQLNIPRDKSINSRHSMSLGVHLLYYYRTYAPAVCTWVVVVFHLRCRYPFFFDSGYYIIIILFFFELLTVPSIHLANMSVQFVEFAKKILYRAI